MPDGNKCYERKLSTEKVVVTNICWINEVVRVGSIIKDMKKNVSPYAIGESIHWYNLLDRNFPKHKRWKPFDSVILPGDTYSTNIFVCNSYKYKIFLQHYLY